MCVVLKFESLPFMDFLFKVFCTECFNLKIDSAGLNTQKQENNNNNNKAARKI